EYYCLLHFGGAQLVF
nr:immunoglobulin light chain junction region [Macaca mulatta]MOX80140.1 immunoglobulin light chain junction region [Macaca mulatta]